MGGKLEKAPPLHPADFISHDDGYRWISELMFAGQDAMGSDFILDRRRISPSSYLSKIRKKSLREQGKA